MKVNIIKILSAVLSVMFIFQSLASAFDTERDIKTLILINDDYFVNDDVYGELVNVADFMPSDKSSILMRSDVAYALEKMYNDMIMYGLYPIVISGYRTKDYQSRLYNKEVRTKQKVGEQNPNESAAYLTATPDTSEHQAGLAVDISNKTTLGVDFENTPEGRWLAENSWKYGFIIRYNKDKTNVTGKSYEPWHFRYVGAPHAEYMVKNNMSLEEYLQLLHEVGSVSIISELDNCLYKIYCTDNIEQEYEHIVTVSSDNMGAYIVTTVSDEVYGNEEIQITPAPTPTPKPKVDYGAIMKRKTEEAKLKFIKNMNIVKEKALYACDKAMEWQRNSKQVAQRANAYINSMMIPNLEKAANSIIQFIEDIKTENNKL